MIKSIFVVLGGFAAMTVATMILFAVLAQLAPDQFAKDAKAPPGTTMILVVLLGGLLSAIAGGWLTGRMAPDAIWSHVLALAGLVVVLGLLSAFMESSHAGPLWYRLALPVVGSSGVLLGGRLL